MEKRKTETQMGRVHEEGFGGSGITRARDRGSRGGSETGSVMKGKWKKLRISINASLIPHFRDKEESNNIKNIEIVMTFIILFSSV